LYEAANVPTNKGPFPQDFGREKPRVQIFGAVDVFVLDIEAVGVYYEHLPSAIDWRAVKSYRAPSNVGLLQQNRRVDAYPPNCSIENVRKSKDQKYEEF
jgi:hypothetical protein